MNTQDINRKIAPASESLSFSGFPAFTEKKINDRFPCYCFENFNSEVVRLDIVVDAGSWIQQKPLQASSMARMMTEGTKEYNAFQIAETIDFSGAYLDVTASNHNTTISIFAVKHILEKLFPLLRSIMTESVFPEEEFRVILANNKQEFIIGNKKVMSLARRIFPSMIYGENHPYGKILKESDFDNLATEDLKQLYNQLPLGSSRCYIGGNIDSNVISSLSEMMQHISTRENGIAEKESEIQPSTDKERVIEIEDAVQSAIMLGIPVVGRSHPDFPLLVLTNTILGGYFGSRLMKSIREEKGFTYGISSGIALRNKASHLSIQTEVKTEITQLALDEIFREISRLSAEKVMMDELNIARNYIFGSLLRSLDGPFALTERLMGVHSINLDPEKYFRYYWDTIASATPEDVLRTAEKYLRPDEMRVLIVGNKN
ncbi:MAG TPA: pitrilysin family protein [Bacteroidales bacterium]|nr:pitrilysin family protein [Bacteroidales bacterium]